MRRSIVMLCVLCLATVLALPAFAAEAPTGPNLLDSMLGAFFGALDFLFGPLADEAEAPTQGDTDEPLPNFGPTIIPVG